jgi:hypothetical protein
MAKLKAKQRKALPSSAFAYPSVRKYPIHDKSHARAALSMAARRNTYGTYAHVAAAVKARYPGIGTKTASKRSTRGKARTRRVSTRRRRTTRR